jgi:hypothetical protein
MSMPRRAALRPGAGDRWKASPHPQLLAASTSRRLIDLDIQFVQAWIPDKLENRV